MSHIVFVLNSFFPETDANTICAYNVMNLLLSYGFEVSCVCGTAARIIESKEKIRGVNVYRVFNNDKNNYRVNSTGFKKIALNILHFLKSVAVLLAFPNVNPKFTKRIFKRLIEIDNIKHIDCLVGVFRPYSSIMAITKFKKCHNDVKIIGYYLDILKFAKTPKGITKRFYYRLCDDKESIIFKRLDVAIVAENGKQCYEKNKKFLNLNIQYVNFPTMIIKEKSNVNMKTHCNKIVYAGYLDKQYRNPESFMKIIINLSRYIDNLQFHIYGYTDMDYVIKKYESNYPELFFYHGKVEKDIVDNAYSEAIALLSIGNNVKDVVPSKIFELFGTKKRIIHISPGENDASLKYFALYPNSLIIENDDTYSNVNKIYDFLVREEAKISNDDLLNNFYSSTPNAVADIIKQYT